MDRLCSISRENAALFQQVFSDLRSMPPQSEPDTEVDEDEEFIRDWVAEIFDRVLVANGEEAT